MNVSAYVGCTADNTKQEKEIMTKKAKKIILAAVGIICVIVIAFCIYINISPYIPGSNEMFKEIMKCELPYD